MVPVAAVAVAETIVEAREATVPSAAMKSANSAVKHAAMKAAASVKTSAPAMRAAVGEA